MRQAGKSNDSKTRWKPKPEDIYHILREHKTWLESDGREGHRAEIYHADLSGAGLYKANLKGAQIWDTYLYEADLREADLTDSEGINPESLAGADLSGALLPGNIRHFGALDDIEKNSKKARSIFWGMLISVFYSWIILIHLSDADLLSRVYLLPSILPGLYIPSAWFFGVLPTLLFVLYIILHLNLQRNWEIIAELPAVFPDNVPLDKKIYKWSVNKLVTTHLRLPETEYGLQQRLLNIFVNLIIWWLVPVTVISFWFRYLVRHDWGLSLFHILISGLSVLLAFFFYFLTRRTLRSRDLKGGNFFLRFVYTLAVFALFLIVSFSLIRSVPSEVEQVDNNLLTLAPKLAGTFGYNLFLDFSEGEISKKPDNRTDSGKDLSLVTGADLEDLHAPYSNGRKAFLVKANLSYANLKQSNLDSADLRAANLTGAKLNRSSLVGTNLEGADLTGTDLEHVNLLGANLRHVKGLTIHTLRMTDNWLYALYGGAILDSLNLPVNHNEKVAGNDLGGYDLSGVNFRGATLAGFNFTGANLQSADLTDADLTGANIFATDLRGAVGLEKEKLQTALNWFFALYDKELMADFGFPDRHNEFIKQKDFRTYSFEGLNLTGADFKGANLRQVNMKNAVLRDVNLQDADLYAVDLTGTDLTGANFKSAILLDTDIRGANLTNAKNLTMEQLRWAIYDSATIFPDSLKDPAGERLRNR